MSHVNKEMVSFFLTTKCNLNCIYCYNSKERSLIKEQSLPLNIAKSGIDYFFSNYKSRHIRFYGPGEPTQEFDILKNITEYAKLVSDREITVEIQTNGIFNKDIRRWLLENTNIVWMSFDGPPDIQNKNRPISHLYKNFYSNKTSAEVLEENTIWLTSNSNGYPIMIGARVTMTDDNIGRQIEMVDYFSGLGIKYIWTDPIFYSVDKIPVCDDKKKLKNFHFNMDKYLQHYIDAYNYAEKKGVFWGSFLAVNFDGESSYHCRACTPVPHITPDGYVSACDMVMLGENAYHMDCLVYGKWDSFQEKFIFDTDKINSLKNRKSTHLYHCKNCSVKLHCGGYCLGEVVNETGILNGVPSKCNAIKFLFEKIGARDPYPFLHP